MVLARIDIGDAAVMSLEVQPTRRNQAIQVLQWRARDARSRRSRLRRNCDAFDVRFVSRRCAVVAHRAARVFHPLLPFHATGLRRQECRASRDPGPQKNPAIKKTVACDNVVFHFAHEFPQLEFLCGHTNTTGRRFDTKSLPLPRRMLFPTFGQHLFDLCLELATATYRCPFVIKL